MLRQTSTSRKGDVASREQVSRVARFRPSRIRSFGRQTERRPSQALSEPSSARVRQALGVPSDFVPASGDASGTRHLIARKRRLTVIPIREPAR